MNDPSVHPSFEPDRRELNRLLSLAHSPPRDGESAAEAALSSEARRALQANRRVARALAADGPAVPPAVHARVETLVATRASRRPIMRAPARLVAPALIGLAIAFALMIVPALLQDTPTVPQVLAVGSRPAEQPAPAPLRGNPAVLDRSVDGVSFPNWAEQLGWIPGGSRSDEIDGRAAETVFYLHEGHRVAYTILSGNAIDPPANARPVNVDGVRLAALAAGGRDVVVFERDGRTCVLSGHVIHARTLARLATWSGDGRVDF